MLGSGYNGCVSVGRGEAQPTAGMRGDVMLCTAGAGNAPNAHNANLSRVEERSLNKAGSSQYPSFTAPSAKGLR